MDTLKVVGHRGALSHAGPQEPTLAPWAGTGDLRSLGANLVSSDMAGARLCDREGSDRTRANELRSLGAALTGSDVARAQLLAGDSSEWAWWSHTTVPHHPLPHQWAWSKLKGRRLAWFELMGWRAPHDPDLGGIVVAEDGRLVAYASPHLPLPERRRFAALVTDYGRQTATGVLLPAGLAQVLVTYVGQHPLGGPLHKPVARALRVTP